MTVYTPTSERQAPATTHRQMWALGDYAAIAEELLAPLGPILVSTSGIRRGDRVLDVAAEVGAGKDKAHAPSLRSAADVAWATIPTRAIVRGIHYF